MSTNHQALAQNPTSSTMAEPQGANGASPNKVARARRLKLRHALVVGIAAVPLAAMGGCYEVVSEAYDAAQSALTPVQRPSLVNTNISTPFSANGHSMSIDGRLILGRVTDGWRFRVMKPESITYSAEGQPNFNSAFSSGKTLTLNGGENASAMCFPDPTKPYTMNAQGRAVYTPWIFDSRMGSDPGPTDHKHFRRRTSKVEVSSPFTKNADVNSATLGSIQYLSDKNGKRIKGIELTMTADGRLLVFQGHPTDDDKIDYLMYSYNPNACAQTGWSVPRPVSTMFSDPEPGLDRYPLSGKPLFAATGEPFASATGTVTNQIRGAYPWIDPEGRDLLYMAVKHDGGGRREAATLLGADTGFRAYNIDGGINEQRQGKSRLFYSSPMWVLERERAPMMSWPPDTSNENRYLPVTKNHDVIPFFGSNTLDYNEVDIGDLSDPYHVLFLPMNEMVTRGGDYALSQTPDLSGGFRTGFLEGNAKFTTNNVAAKSSSGSLFEAHAKGRSLDLVGGGALRVPLSGAGTTGIGVGSKGFSIQLVIKPGANINVGCSGNPWRYLVYKSDGTNGLDMVYEPDNTVQMSFRIGGTRVRLGRSAPLPKNKWTHVAYSWDGVSGEFSEYINGVATNRTMPNAKGDFKLGEGDLFIGAGSPINTQACPSSGGSFVGGIDEVRLFSHARSARSVCLTSMGANCIGEAIKNDPTPVQRVMNQQQPECNGSGKLGSAACTSAMHRLCAQQGASAALDSAQNLSNTVTQLVSERPPVAMAGVVASYTTTNATVACTPIEHENQAVTYQELNRHHSGCTDDASNCDTAAHRFCDDLGWDTGIVFERTTRPWVNCFNAGKIISVAKTSLVSACQQNNWTSASCQVSMNQACKAQGYDAGVLQEVTGGTMAQIHCFDAAAMPVWTYAP